jgi:hypothetical protein
MRLYEVYALIAFDNIYQILLVSLFFVYLERINEAANLHDDSNNQLLPLFKFRFH